MDVHNCTSYLYNYITIMILINVSCRYGQMTAGSYCYIGPQGIVHGTTVSCLVPSVYYLDPVCTG